MADITELTISYPDFVSGNVMNPEEFDQNNSEITTKINEIVGRHNTLENALIALEYSKMTISDTIKEFRILDGNIQYTLDGTNWVTPNTSGHVIYDSEGNPVAQRTKLKIMEATLTDDGEYTILTALPGATGATGAKGDTGATGAQGEKGDIGSVIVPSVDVNGVMSFTLQDTAIAPNSVSVRGPQGPQGVQGAQGAQGVAGAQGVQGVQGVQGIAGAKGDKGADGASFSVLGLYANISALETAHPTGSAGDAYAVGTSDSNLIYLWDVNDSAWTNVGALQGPQGPQGIQGVQGVQGAQGIQGIDGVAGADGASAYETAVAGGYTGSETTFNESLADVPGHLIDYVASPPYAGATSGSANTYTIASPTITSLTAGMGVVVKINVDSTGASTLNWCSLGAVAIKKPNGSDATNLKAGGVYTLRYDGTNFILQGEGASGDATASDLLSGKTATTDAGDITGTMTDNGTVSTDITTKAQQVIIGAGKHSGSGIVQISATEQAKIIAGNIKAGVTLLGQAGNTYVVDTSAGDAVAGEILSGKKAYVDGALVTGTIASKGTATYTPGTSNQTIASGQYLSGTQTISGDADLVAGNIKKNVGLFGVTGTYEGSYKPIIYYKYQPVALTLTYGSGTPVWQIDELDYYGMIYELTATADAGNVTMYSTSTIDVTPYSKLIYHGDTADCSYNYKRMGLSSTTSFSYSTGYAASCNMRYTDEVDISSLSGSYYFKMCFLTVNTTYRLNVFQIMLVV